MILETTPAVMSADDVIGYLAQRAAAYGGTVGDMLDRTPIQLWDSPNELMMYWSERDLSHIFPQSEFPDLADDWDNIIAEPFPINRGRGASIMTADEREYAEMVNETDADIIDALHTDDSVEFMAALADAID